MTRECTARVGRTQSERRGRHLSAVRGPGALHRRTILRLLSSFRSSRAEGELTREIRSHLQLLEDQYTEFRGSERDLTLRGMARIVGYGIVMLGVCLPCVVPTRRALNVEPTVALRTE